MPAGRQDVGHRSHALLFIDSDRFKPVNGCAPAMPPATNCSKLVASVIRSSCRARGFRPPCLAATIRQCCSPTAYGQRPTGSLRKSSIPVVGIEFSSSDAALSPSACVLVGIAPSRRIPEGDVLATADAACYVAKALGRGLVAVARQLEPSQFDLRWLARMASGMLAKTRITGEGSIRGQSRRQVEPYYRGGAGHRTRDRRGVLSRRLARHC